MAPAKKEMKRKAPAVSDPPAKKTKKVQAKPVETSEEAAPKSILKKKADAAPKAKEIKAAAPVKANGTPARQAKPRKRAADFISDEETEEPAAPSPAAQKKASNKKSKKEETAPAPAEKKAKATPKKKVEEVAVESEESEIELNSADSDSEEEEDEVLDDQTAALIKGFESSDDEDDNEGESHNPNKPIPKIPDISKNQQKKIMRSQKKTGTPDEPGTVYVGRIPHGFYEHEMRAYFSQFGEITRLRLSRNRLTGRSKHYAFIEFASATVAKIVAETMDNYLMYSHILKCKFVPQDQLHPEVWKGANRRFKKTPWNRIEKKRLEKGKTREQWTKRIEQEQKRRQAKIDQLKALGYEIDLPQLKSVDDVPIQEAPKAAVEAPVVKEDTPKKAKKAKKVEEETPKQKATTESPATKKKAKKTKAKA
ncbi:Ribosomal biogenesis protein Gar2 [Penicillium sp. IBT 35674x]|nr:Ribosomal biogenesis protein Gar2 [Penicillium sp. IBT 35674x]